MGSLLPPLAASIATVAILLPNGQAEAGFLLRALTARNVRHSHPFNTKSLIGGIGPTAPTATDMAIMFMAETAATAATGRTAQGPRIVDQLSTTMQDLPESC